MSSREEDQLTMDNLINGFILSNIYIPEEVLLNILASVNWEDLLACRLVCQKWRKIIDTMVCFEKLKKFSFKTLNESFTGPISKLKTDGIPFYLYFAISNGVFGKNILKNAFGSGDDPHVCEKNNYLWPRGEYTGEREKKYIPVCKQIDCPKFKHWGVLNSGGDGWAVEVEPIGSEPLPSHLPGRSCFVTSFGWCEKEQLITLAENGLSSLILDHVQPQFDVSEWYARRWDCGVKYKLQVQLLDHKKEVVQEFKVGTEETPEIDEWIEVSHSFKDYGPGVRYILFNHAGVDTQFWAGHYGSKIAGGSVIARIPLSRFERSCDSSALS